jgi:hypothetical protein
MTDHEISTSEIRNLIHHIRGKAIMLDYDLAALYEVETGVLKRAVRRNIERFPDDFMFELNKTEYESLRCQIGILKRGEHSKYLPFAFTEQGVAMLSGVLNSRRAILANIQIMRAFVAVKRLGMTILDIRRKIDNMESKYDHQFKVVFDAMRLLLDPPEGKKKKQKMGFQP